MIFRLKLSNTEILNLFDMKNIDASTTGYTLPPDVYEASDLISVIKALLPNDVKVNISVDGIRLKSNLTKNNTIRFTQKLFF